MGKPIDEALFNCLENDGGDSVKIFKRCDAFVGYGTKSGLYAIRSLSIISLILNFMFLIYQFFKIKRNKKNKRKNSMRTLFQILPIFDCILSIYWIISSFYFPQAKDINDNIGFCTFLSIFYQACFTFQFIMINCILFHFKLMNLSPMTGILKPKRNLLIYILLSLIISLIVGIFSIYFSIGRSPMNTCFINTIDTENYGLFFLIPIGAIFVAIGQIILDLCCKGVFITDRGIRILYKKNSYYVLIFCFLHFPMLIFFLHTTIVGKDLYEMSEDSFQIYSFIMTLFTSMIPLIIGLIRYFQGLTKIDCISECIKHSRISKARLTKNLEKSQSIKIENSINLLIENDPFEWLESHVMKCFMRDILIGIASALKRSKKYGKKIELKNGGNSMNYERYTINFGVLKDLKLGDESINKSDYLNINIVNYAPRSFAYLRQLENIDIDEMIESFLPKNNTQGLKKSQGKSGSFFISTDDNKYMVKSLKSDEIDLIRNGFLSKYIMHIEKTENESLLCRLYGMYNIMMAQGQEFLIIVMRNVIGDFKDNTVVKFDLKGSTYNRKANFDMDNTNNNVMKDLNFDEIEKNIMIGTNSINKLRDIVRQDSQFLCNSELMDYSLFLVKLTLSKEESIDIFGENIIEYRNNALKKIFKNNDSNNILNNSQDEKISEIEEKDKIDIINDSIKINDSVIRKGGKGELKDIRYYNQYLFPSLREGSGYIISIIDYFQYFNFFKVVEANVISKFKTGFNRERNNTISCVNPVKYSERFIKYFNHLTDISTIKQFNQNNELFKIEEKEEEYNIDNDNENNDNEEEKEEEKKEEGEEKEDERINIPENSKSKKEQINFDIKEKDNVNFNLKITIMNKNLAKKESFLKKSNTMVNSKQIKSLQKKNT